MKNKNNLSMVIVSDTHGSHNYLDIPKGDVLIHCGDAELCDWGRYNSFMKWFSSYPHPHKIFVPGNHDFLMQEKQFNCSLEFESNGINVLIDRELIIDGIKFYGTPYAPVFMDWCFMKEEKNLVPHWDAIPDDTNVLITHGPAYGIGDCIDGTKRHLGCKGLTRRLKHLNQLAYHFYGHIHTGKKTPDENELGFKSINCSVLNEQYKLVFPAVEVKYIS